MRLIHYILIALLWGFLFSAYAKAQIRVLPILEQSSDARATAMGGLSMVENHGMYLYQNPAMLHYAPKDFSVEAGVKFFPKLEDAGREKLTSLSLGYSFLERHVVLAGLRYLGGLSFAQPDPISGADTDKRFFPYTLTLDLGYSYLLNEQLSLFLTSGFIRHHTSRTGFAGTFSLGANYRQDLSEARWNIGAKVSDFGTPLIYQNGAKYALPTSAELSGSYSMLFSDEGTLSGVAGVRYFFLPSKGRLLRAGIGTEYCWRKLLALRAGYDYGDKGTGGISGGVGINYNDLRLDLTYRHGTHQHTPNSFVITLGYAFGKKE